MDFHSFRLEEYLDLHAIGRGPRIESKKGMLVARNLMPHFFQMGLHWGILPVSRRVRACARFGDELAELLLKNT